MDYYGMFIKKVKNFRNFIKKYLANIPLKKESLNKSFPQAAFHESETQS